MLQDRTILNPFPISFHSGSLTFLSSIVPYIYFHYNFQLLNLKNQVSFAHLHGNKMQFEPFYDKMLTNIYRSPVFVLFAVGRRNKTCLVAVMEA